MKIVFLDFDGPMMPRRSYVLPGNNGAGYWPSQFDPVAALWIESILQAAPAKLVISSTWRREGREFIDHMLRVNGINPAHLHEDWSTKIGVNDARDREIREWLDRHRGEIEDYVVIDDEETISTFKNRAILVDYEDGMLSRHFHAICNRFGLTVEEDRGALRMVAWVKSIHDQFVPHDLLMAQSKDSG